MVLLTRGALITSSAEATGVNIATWFLATTFLVMYLSRQIVKFVMLRKLQLDDYLMTAGMLFALGLSLAFSIAADNGLGNEVVDASAFSKIQKAYYAADLCFIIATCCVKLALVSFFENIAVDELQKRIILGLGAVCTASTVCMLFAAAFQCGASLAWEVMTLHCFDQTAYWIVFGVIDILTDLGLIAISFMLVWELRIPISRKAVVIGCFAPRILVVAAAASRLAFLAPVSPHDNPAFKVWISVVCTELQMCLSISTACIPCIKPFFEGVEAGVWQADQLRRQGFSINDLFSKGYVKASEDWESSQRSDSTPKAHAETKSGEASSEGSQRSGENMPTLPAFTGGQWQGSM